MSSHPPIESNASAFDTVKLVAAVFILLGAVVAYQYFAEISPVYRALGMLGATVVAAGLMFATRKGAVFVDFFRESRLEVRRVIWPTRQEAFQTTLIVVALVFVVGLFLWLLDMLLSWGVTLLLGQGA